MPAGKRFLIFDTEDSELWRPVSFADMFKELLAIPGDGSQWDVCSVARGEAVPSTAGYDGIVITGSHYNVPDDNDKLPWFEALCRIIVDASSTGAPRIYGGCYGCQIMAHALGGTVGLNPDPATPGDKRLVLKAETMELVSPDWAALLPERPEDPRACLPGDADADSAAICSRDPTGLTLIESHSYCVTRLPDDRTHRVHLLASSPTCATEMYIAGRNGNLLAVQGHPEFEQQYSVWERIFPEDSDKLSAKQAEECRNSLRGFRFEHSRWVVRLIHRCLHAHADYDALVAAVRGVRS